MTTKCVRVKHDYHSNAVHFGDNNETTKPDPSNFTFAQEKVSKVRSLMRNFELKLKLKL